jgi:predicted RNase H-like nuclease (RuvC/YqgF family)
MSKSTTPRTDANKHALDHLERYGFENSLDDPVVEWPILCEEIERELAEAKEQRDKWSNLWADLSRSCVKDIAKLERGLAEAREQRDRLAEALRELCETLLVKEPRDITDLLNKAGEALAAVKGGTPNNCQRPELCLLTETCIPCAICPHAVEGGTP